MAKYQREATQYPGVFWLTIQGIETLYIRYKRPGTDKAVEEKNNNITKNKKVKTESKANKPKKNIVNNAKKFWFFRVKRDF